MLICNETPWQPAAPATPAESGEAFDETSDTGETWGTGDYTVDTCNAFDETRKGFHSNMNHLKRKQSNL